MVSFWLTLMALGPIVVGGLFAYALLNSDIGHAGHHRH